MVIIPLKNTLSVFVTSCLFTLALGHFISSFIVKSQDLIT